MADNNIPGFSQYRHTACAPVYVTDTMELTMLIEFVELHDNCGIFTIFWNISKTF
jgi:hypothetical protein